MPTYSARCVREPGHLDFPFYPCYGYDADGKTIGPGVIVDTDTGVVQRQIVVNGKPILDGYNHPEIPGARDGEMPLETVQFRPPIVFERELRTTWRDRPPLL